MNNSTKNLKEEIMNNYEINKETLIIYPHEKEKSLIKENCSEYIINLSPIKIINESCLYFGSSYLGRLQSTKRLFGYSKKVPIIIEESNNIIFFPLESPRLNSCIWISLNNIIVKIIKLKLFFIVEKRNFYQYHILVLIIKY